MAALDDALKAAEQSAHNRDSGIDDLFGEVVPTHAGGNGEVYAEFRKVRPWSDKERLGGERDTLGLYITGHPIDEYKKEIRKFVPKRIVDLAPDRFNSQTIAGLIMSARAMNGARGPMAVLLLDDSSAQIEVTLFGEKYMEFRELLVKDTIVIVEGKVSVDEKTQNLSMRGASSVRSLLQARESYASNLTIEVTSDSVNDRFTDLLEKTLAGSGGGTCPVSLIYCQPNNRAQIRLGERWQVVPSDELLQELREVVGARRVALEYR